MPVSLNPFSFFAAFFAGILVSFTPCVYPFIPITISYIGSKGSASKIRGFFLSLAYTSGLALTYALLGTAAALSGRVFGSWTQSAAFYLLMGSIYLILGLSMLDIFKLPLKRIPWFNPPAESQTLVKSYFSIFFLGLLSGLVIGPCTTPFLGAILTYIAKERDIILGMLLLVSFAFGMSLVLILSGTFSGLCAYLPKSGVWNDRLKKIGALFLIVGAEYFFIKAGGLL